MKNPAVYIFLFFIKAYQMIFSALFGPNCRFYPSCSCYAREALVEHGVLKGLYLVFHRLLRCHPWCKDNHFHDPVPKQFTWGDIIGYNRSGEVNSYKKKKASCHEDV